MKWNHKAIARARKLREKEKEIRKALKIEKRYASTYGIIRINQVN